MVIAGGGPGMIANTAARAVVCAIARGGSHWGMMNRVVPYPDDEAVPVIVPRNDRALVPTAPERVRKLQQHLASLVVRMRDNEPASVVQAAPEGFVARVVTTACSLCQGWCCRNGDNDGFLDEATLARAQPQLTAKAIMQIYLERVPPMGYQDSCIFHGAKGCTLDRALRSNVCNTYYCKGLHDFVASDAEAAPIVVIAGEPERMVLSPVLVP